jgi:hypothetical protein
MVTDQATALTMVIDRITAMEMATAMADMGLTTDQVHIIVRVVMGAIGHMMGVMVVIAKVVAAIDPTTVGLALGATEAMVVLAVMVVGTLVIRVDGSDHNAI